MNEARIEVIAAAGQRLDRFLAEACPQLSRSRIQALIKEGRVLVDGQAVGKNGYMLSGGETVRCDVPATEAPRIAAEDIPLAILYEDSDIIVVDKPQGMVVHPAAGHHQGTLVNALLNHCGDLSGINGVVRPGIVHRIDKDTSGILVAAKNDAAHVGLTKQWQGHRIKRLYHALLLGVMAENAGIIDAPLGRHPRDRVKMAVEPLHGRSAITHYQVLRRYSAYTYAQLRLETGRTHQIRVHMAHLGHPVAGDRVYGPKKQALPAQGQVLHAKVLGFAHPISGEAMEFDSPLPPYFEEMLHLAEQQP